ncbi:MAG: arginine--tRNA ligase [Bacillota bacterium]
MDFKLKIAEKISALVDMEIDKVIELMEVPPHSNMGDYAFPCFQLAKVMRKAPNMIAAELAPKVETDNIVEKAEAAGGYLNFFLNKKEYVGSIISKVLEQGGQYGSDVIGQGKAITIDFSSPNVAKPFHIGHMSSTIIGGSLEKIFAYLGYKVERINHLGDYGTQFGKLISAYKRWVDQEALEKQPISELLRIYVKFHEEAEQHPELEDEARAYFKLLEEGDKEAHALWEKFRALSIKEFEQTYKKLHIEFDSYAGESFYTDKMGEVIEILEQKNLLVESSGAKIVDLSQFNLPPCLVIKSDGTTIYVTRDLAAALYRKRTYDFYKNVYVVGTTQSLHFAQLFRVLELMGFEWAKDCIHIGFGLVKFPDRKLSTRKGDVVLLEEVLEEAVQRTLNLIEQKNPDLANKEEVAKKVGIGAVVYTFLKNNRDRDIVFSWEDTINFDGDSGPYVQYTYVRGRSILRRAGQLPESADYSVLTSDDEFNLIKLIGGFGAAVKEAAERYEPFVVTRHITEIAKAYNKFYINHPILNADEKIKNARLHLTQAVCTVIQTGLRLICIETPENM